MYKTTEQDTLYCLLIVISNYLSDICITEKKRFCIKVLGR